MGNKPADSKKIVVFNDKIQNLSIPQAPENSSDKGSKASLQFDFKFVLISAAVLDWFLY